MKTSKLKIGLAVLALMALVMPLTTQSASPKTDTIVLTSDNTITLNDEVTGESVSAVVEAAKKLDAQLSATDRLKGGNKKPIYLFLNTPGGSIQAGLELIEQLKSLKRPVHTITLFAASMGFQIAQNLGDRVILKTGVLMSHRAYGGFEGEFGGAATSQLDSRYGLWLDRINEMDQQTVDRTNGKQTLESYQKAYASELWLTGNKSVAQGYADKVAQVSCDSSLAGFTTNSINFMGIEISYDLSKCPMNTTPTNIRVGIVTNKGSMKLSDFQAKSGGFGYACLQAAAKDDKVLCAIDLTLNVEKLSTIGNEFKNSYLKKQKQVIYMKFGS